jgi:hypothetical protein
LDDSSEPAGASVERRLLFESIALTRAWGWHAIDPHNDARSKRVST